MGRPAHSMPPPQALDDKLRSLHEQGYSLGMMTQRVRKTQHYVRLWLRHHGLKANGYTPKSREQHTKAQRSKARRNGYTPQSQRYLQKRIQAAQEGWRVVYDPAVLRLLALLVGVSRSVQEISTLLGVKYRRNGDCWVRRVLRILEKDGAVLYTRLKKVGRPKSYTAVAGVASVTLTRTLESKNRGEDS